MISFFSIQILHLESYGTMPMFADAYISRLGHLWYFRIHVFRIGHHISWIKSFLELFCALV